MQLKGPALARQQGFTLVEVLVTVFVVAVGLLAAAALQAISKKAAIDAMQRTTATVLAQEMVERIRSNPVQLDRYRGGLVKSGAASTTAPSCGSGTACTPEQTVALDFAQWWRSLEGASETIGGASAGGLRAPRGCVRCAGGGNWVEVIIEWRGLTAIDQTPDASNPDDPLAAQCEATPLADYEADGTVSFRRVLRLQAHIKTSRPCAPPPPIA